MLDYSALHWLTFFSAAFLLNLSPGPDMAYIVGQSATRGLRAGYSAMFGLWAGTFLHVLLAALGLSVIIATSALAFGIVKWLGALYLIWLGLQALMSPGARLNTDVSDAPRSHRRIFLQGALVSALNPKVAVFFLAFLPQFVVEGAGPVSLQLFLHGSLIIAVAALIEPLIVWAGAALASGLRRHPRVGVWMDRSLGVLLVGLGIRLAFSELRR